MTMSINGTNGLTFNDASTQNTAATGFGFKNRIINGAMVIDQRNAGASVTPVNNGYTVDRFKYIASQTSKFTAQQNAGGVTPPAGFKNYLGFTSSSSFSPASTDYFAVGEIIEGYNVADLAYGTASAKTVTLSFWVYSSLTGTFGLTLSDGSYSYGYGATYSVPVANTWTQISITVPGNTTGTWNTTNGTGLAVYFSLGSGTTAVQPVGVWGTWSGSGISGAVSVVGTSGATFYITGVQLEKGSTATSFDYRPYGTELALCQRYLPAVLSSGVNSSIFIGQWISASQALMLIPFNVPARVPPTGVTISALADISIRNSGGGSGGIATSISVANSNTQSAEFNMVGLTAGTGAGQAGVGYFISATGKILFTGCEL